MLTIAQPLVHPADDVLRDIREQLFTRSLVPVDIILEQFGVVVRHLFEVRHHPLLVDGVTVEPTGKLVVNSSPSHVLERGHDYFTQLIGTCSDGRRWLSGGAKLRSLSMSIPFNQQLKRRWMRKLRRLAKASMLGIEHLECRFLDRRD